MCTINTSHFMYTIHNIHMQSGPGQFEYFSACVRVYLKLIECLYIVCGTFFLSIYNEIMLMLTLSMPSDLKDSHLFKTRPISYPLS